jgi:hypothetical protein
MSVFRAIYTSVPFGFDSSILSSILLDARRLNTRDDITGALICRGDIYVQLLEGAEDKVRAALDRIKRDDRHLEVTLHVAGTAPERMFPGWAMLHDPAASWIWSQQEVAAGAAERATPQQVTEFFTRLQGSAMPDQSD